MRVSHSAAPSSPIIATGPGWVTCSAPGCRVRNGSRRQSIVRNEIGGRPRPDRRRGRLRPTNAQAKVQSPVSKRPHRQGRHFAGLHGDIDGDPAVVVSGAGSASPSYAPGDDIAERYLLDACRAANQRRPDRAGRGAPGGVKERPSRPFGQSSGRSIATVRLLGAGVHDATVHEKGRRHRCRALRAARPGRESGCGEHVRAAARWRGARSSRWPNYLGDEESCAVTCRVHRSEGVPQPDFEARLIARLPATTWIRRGRLP